ncbi:MAG: hypothetical protein WBL63_13425 [Candidatus Acidiferrum sp.]
MSEYQFYDFRTLDRPLTRNEMPPTGLYMDAGTGTKKEHRQALSAGEERSLRGGAIRQSMALGAESG